MSRGVWRIFAVALRPVSAARSTRTRSLDFSGVLERAVKLLKRDGRVRAEPLPARGALPPRAGGRVPGHEPRAVGAGRAAGPELGRGPRRGGRRAAARRSSSSAIASSRSTASATPTSRCSTTRRRSSQALRPDGDPRQAISVSFRAVPGAARVRQRRVRRDRGQGRRAPRRVQVRRARSVPGTDESRPASPDRRRPAAERRPGERRRRARHDRRRDRHARRPKRSPTRSSGCCRPRRCAIGRPASGAPRRPADVGHPVPIARQPSRVRERRSSVAAFRPTSTRGSASSTRRRDAGRGRAAAISGATRLSDLRAAALLRSRLVRLSDAGVSALAPELAEALARPEPPAACRDLGRRGSARARPAAHGSRRRGCRGSIASRRPSCSMRCSGETAYAYETARAAAPAGARESQEAARASCARIQNRGYATLARDRRPPRPARGRRRIERGDRRRRRGQPDDRARGQGARVPDRVRRQHRPRHRRASGRRSASRLDAAGEPSVAIADYQSEADEDAQAREREETKRLLYVALTRARDRLYLSATVAGRRLPDGRAAASARCCRDRSWRFLAVSLGTRTAAAWTAAQVAGSAGKLTGGRA